MTKPTERLCRGLRFLRGDFRPPFLALPAAGGRGEQAGASVRLSPEGAAANRKVWGEISGTGRRLRGALASVWNSLAFLQDVWNIRIFCGGVNVCQKK